MKLFRSIRSIIAVGCLVAAFFAHAGEQPAADGKCVAQPVAVELRPLQGTWVGTDVGERSSREKVTITISGSSFHFHRDTNFWFDTTITVPAGKVPKQLHATIKGCPPSQASSMGQVVVAIFKIEEGTLILATGNGDGEAPKSFEATGDNGLNRYELRKVPPQQKNISPPKTK